MGLTFKENCPDLRNTRVLDIANEFENCHCNVDLYDPWVKAKSEVGQIGLKTIDKPANGHYDAIIIAVAHDEFKKLSKNDIQAFAKETYVLYDIKYLLNADEVDGRL